MSSTSSSPEGRVGPVQLNGWKEIAAYLGRSVRTVQRWEKDFGLPVRRLGHSKPESVFALPREIDRWLETAHGINALSGAGVQEPSSDPESLRVPAPGLRALQAMLQRPWLNLTVVAILTAMVALLGLWAVWHTLQSPPAAAQPASATAGDAPAAWDVDLDTLVVTDAKGQTLWKHVFPRELAGEIYLGLQPVVPRPVLGGIADVDGDGSREVWFVAQFEGERSPANTALHLFEHDGRLRWTYKPSAAVSFGADRYGPSWIVDRAFVTADPGGGKGRALWTVLYDAALFPSALQRLDPRTGEPLSTYWSNGSIVALALDLDNNRRRLFVGASNNEHKAGSLAVLDALNPNGSAPAELDKYRCTSCPAGEPGGFLVFPKAARFGPSDLTAPVSRITPLADGGVTLGVLHAIGGGRSMAVAIYTLDAGFNPRFTDTADEYLSVYQALVSRGDAPAGAPSTIDPDREFFPILRWNSAARRFTEVFLRR